ncbi:MAG: cadherin-like domain-containing protein [Polyangiaceae bacterium]|nr:cadherin-like domain-containing protein [Polyangiaceae bacterium]
MTSFYSKLALAAALSSTLASACSVNKTDGSAPHGAEAENQSADSSALATLNASNALGRVNAALSVPEEAKHDVALAQFSVVPQDGECGDTPVAQTTAAVETETLHSGVDLANDSGYQAFVDGLMTLPPGEYKVCVQPLQANGSPSEVCAAAESTATVFPEVTTEITMISQCSGNPNGALDVITVFNDPPLITNIDIAESKFILACEVATFTVAAEDPNGDALTYVWQQTAGPATGSLVGDGTSATYAPSEAGVYEFQVTVTDVHGASTSLTFPLYVSESDDSCALPCPDGTVEAAGYCWVQAEALEDGIASCARFDLVGGASYVESFAWTPEVMDEVTTAWGCTNIGDQGCCQSQLFIDVATNECYTHGFFSETNQPFTNGITRPGYTTAIHACQRPAN